MIQNEKHTCHGYLYFAIDPLAGVFTKVHAITRQCPDEIFNSARSSRGILARARKAMFSLDEEGKKSS